MAKKRWWLVLMLLFGSCLLMADKVVELADIKKPSQVLIGQNNFYITEEAYIYIYSLKDFRLIKKIGGAGEGPKNFKLNPFGPGLQLFQKGNKLVANSEGRISLITSDGEFLNEIRVKPFSLFIPVGENYVGNASETDDEHHMWIYLNIYDSKMAKLKSIYRTDHTIGTGLYSNLLFNTITLPYESFVYPVYKDKIYIPSEKDDRLEIKVFDKMGNLIKTLPLITLKKLKVTEDYKTNLTHWFRDLSPLKKAWEKIKGNILFKTYFPLYKNILLDNDLIYIVTYQQRARKHEGVILNTKGERIKQVWLELPPEEPFAPVCYAIKDARFYSLHENESTENWELHINEIR